MGVGEGLNVPGGPDDVPIDSIVTSLDELTDLYRSPFVLIGTDGADGGLDVSPRGGPPGFVRVLDDRRVAVPDLNGNNLIDSLRAVVATGRAAQGLVASNDVATRDFLEQSYADDLPHDAPER